MYFVFICDEMECKNCVRIIRASVQDIVGVAGVRANISKKRVVITLDKPSVKTIRSIKQATAAKGYVLEEYQDSEGE